jgi:hypothetical protein
MQGDDNTAAPVREATAAKPTFELDATEEELLEEFGVLLAAEYSYRC